MCQTSARFALRCNDSDLISMKGLLFTYALTYGGAVVSLFNPFYWAADLRLFCDHQAGIAVVLVGAGWQLQPHHCGGTPRRLGR